MKKRAQSALEYMMTYGWAILIIVIVAAILYSLGIFNPSSNAGTTATGFSPFTVLAQECGPAGLVLQLGNNAGATVNVTAASVTTQTGLNATASIPKIGTSTFKNVISGGSVILNSTGAMACTTSGARYSATIAISYTEINALGLQTLTAGGTVAGTAHT